MVDESSIPEKGTPVLDEDGNFRYELLKVEESGREWRRYPNGHIRDQKGSFVVMPPEAKAEMITKDNAQLRYQQRKEKHRKAVEDGIMRGLRATDVYEAVSVIMEKRALVAASDDGRNGNDAAKLIMQALDALPDRQVNHEVVNRQEYSIDPATMEIVEKMLEYRREK